MEKEHLYRWLKEQQDVLDKILYNACSIYIDVNERNQNFGFDLAQCQSESYNLSQGRDLCYDRPNIALSYAMWYHGRRVNTSLQYFTKSIIESSEKTIEIFDLGAGTGAVAFAFALIQLGLAKFKGTDQVPHIKIINVDTSPFMLEFNRSYLWPAFKEAYPDLDEKKFQQSFSVNTWTSTEELNVTYPWITASYLFDISDKLDKLNDSFLEILKVYQPSKLFLLTSNQSQKRESLKKLTEVLKQAGCYLEANDPELIYTGIITKVNQLRRPLLNKHGCWGAHNDVKWNDNSYYGVVLSTTTLNLGSISQRNDNLVLFKPPIVVRTDIRLSQEQKKAAEFFGRPSVIIGPAGSGKSVVITEKVAKLVRGRDYDPNLRILVTSFNRGLIKKLGDWLQEMLDPIRVTHSPDSYHGDDSSKFTFQGSNIANVRILNFDVLPTRLGDIKGNLIFKDDCLTKFQELIQRKIIDDEIKDARMLDLLDPEFLVDEFDRVFYGLNIYSRQDYLDTPRKGRGAGLGKNQKNVIYSLIREFFKSLVNENKETFKTLRRKFLKQLNDGSKVKEKYDYIFVDEFQDCTTADFDIFFGLFKKPEMVNNLTLAGDLAQSIQIGRSADIPRHTNMRNINKMFLTGSYRLPQRVSEAIRPLSKEIVNHFENNDGVKEIMPVKHSLPGARPIVVYAKNLLFLREKIVNIYNYYSVFEFDCITILEKDGYLKQALSESGFKVETDTILKLKGLEKKCVLWSTQIPVEDMDDAFEFVYTILTRTSCILIICLFDGIAGEYKAILNLLDRHKLILWDLEPKSHYECIIDEINESTSTC